MVGRAVADGEDAVDGLGNADAGTPVGSGVGAADAAEVERDGGVALGPDDSAKQADAAKAVTSIRAANTFFIRGGWKFNYSWFGLNGSGIDPGTTFRPPIQTSLERGSFGAGVRVPFDTYVINVDYAYTVFSALQDVHRFTVSFAMK